MDDGKIWQLKELGCGSPGFTIQLTVGEKHVLKSLVLEKVLFKILVLCQPVDTWGCNAHDYCLREARWLINHIFDIQWSLHFFLMTLCVRITQPPWHEALFRQSFLNTSLGLGPRSRPDCYAISSLTGQWWPFSSEQRLTFSLLT